MFEGNLAIIIKNFFCVNYYSYSVDLSLFELISEVVYLLLYIKFLLGFKDIIYYLIYKSNKQKNFLLILFICFTALL